jgi:hypothetical protein
MFPVILISYANSSRKKMYKCLLSICFQLQQIRYICHETATPRGHAHRRFGIAKFGRKKPKMLSCRRQLPLFSLRHQNDGKQENDKNDSKS